MRLKPTAIMLKEMQKDEWIASTLRLEVKVIAIELTWCLSAHPQPSKPSALISRYALPVLRQKHSKGSVSQYNNTMKKSTIC